MNNTSLAAQTLPPEPGTVAPPSFDGHGWLVALNMGATTDGGNASACVAATSQP